MSSSGSSSSSDGSMALAAMPLAAMRMRIERQKAVILLCFVAWRRWSIAQISLGALNGHS